MKFSYKIKKTSWFILCLLITYTDFFTKSLAIKNLEPYKSWHILKYLNLTLVYNTGAAFSILDNSGAWHLWFFIIFNSIISIVIAIWLYQTNIKHNLKALSLSLILAGALGNLIDRFMRGYVIDFIDLHYNNYHWPIFNLADIAICVGATILATQWHMHSNHE